MVTSCFIFMFNTWGSLFHVGCWMHVWAEYTDYCLGLLSVAIIEYVRLDNLWIYFNLLLWKSISTASDKSLMLS